MVKLARYQNVPDVWCMHVHLRMVLAEEVSYFLNSMKSYNSGVDTGVLKRVRP
jgi:hypothetical protein